MSVLLRLAITAAALWVATRVVPGISFTGEWPWLLAVALVFGVLNLVVRPFLILLSLPAVIVTLGLFLLVLNGVKARGGSIDGPGAVIVGGMVFISSGYPRNGGVPGNVLLAFAP